MKQKQKQLLTEVMNADAKDGLYDHIPDAIKMVTAVEWFWILLPEEISKEYFDLFEQAKKMEKEQIIKAWETRATPYPVLGMGYSLIQATGEQYYNETYGK